MWGIIFICFSLKMIGKSPDTMPNLQELWGYKGQLNSLHNEVEEWIPKWVDSDFFKKFSMKISDSDEETRNMLNLVPENERNLFILKSAHIQKQFNGLSMKQSFRLVNNWERSSDFYLKLLEGDEKFDENDILKLIYKTVNKWENPFDGIQVPNGLRFIRPQINEILKDNNGILYLDKLPRDVQELLSSWIRIIYTDLLSDRVLKFLSENPDTSPESLIDNDEFLEFYVSFYNVVNRWLGKPQLNYTSLSEDNKKILRDDFKAELSSLDFKVYNVNADLLREKEERDRRIREENQKRFEKWKKRNEEINNRKSYPQENSNNEGNNTNTESGNDNIQDASWADIAENAWLWKQLKEQYNNSDHEDKEDLQINEQVFSLARSRFIENHNKLKSSITEEIMSNIYDKNTNTIKNLDDKAWYILKNIFKDHTNELNEIYKQLSDFPDEINNTKKEFTRNKKIAEAVKDEDKNNQTIGIVIDNVRDIFKETDKSSNETEWNLPNRWLKLREQEPVKIEWDDLVISWVFNWADVMVRYNLKSGEIFMNSFVQYDDNNSKMIIWNNSVANYKIWQLASFDKMIENYESLDSQLGSISAIIAEKSKKQSAMNSIIIKFMKTFNITQNDQENRNIILDKWSNLFDILQIIKNTEDLDAIEKFQDFMKIVMDYACLNWWDNNLLGSQRGQWDGDYYDITFDENNKDEYITQIKECAEGFSKNPSILSRTENINSSYQLWFADLIKKYITTDENEPNKKLAPDKIDYFIDHLRNNNKEQTTTN